MLLLAIDRLIGLRVTAEEEDLGLDLTQHGQRGYMMGEGELIGIELTCRFCGRGSDSAHRFD